MDTPIQPERPSWRSRAAHMIKRRMKRRVAILAMYLVLLQLPIVADWRKDLPDTFEPRMEQLAADLRKLTLIAIAERQRREAGAQFLAFKIACPVPLLSDRDPHSRSMLRGPATC